MYFILLQDHFYTPAVKKVPATGYVEERIRNLQRKMSKMSGGRGKSRSGAIIPPASPSGRGITTAGN